jgi:hypothetical protein
VVTVLWLALLVGAAAWEIRCRRSGSRWIDLGQIGARMGSRIPGRIALLVVWAFIGWHLFARYTVPG